MSVSYLSLSFFFNDTATTEIYTLSLHDALPISSMQEVSVSEPCFSTPRISRHRWRAWITTATPLGSSTSLSRSEEHTSELQSPDHLVGPLLLEKKHATMYYYICRLSTPHPTLSI